MLISGLNPESVILVSLEIGARNKSYSRKHQKKATKTNKKHKSLFLPVFHFYLFFNLPYFSFKDLDTHVLSEFYISNTSQIIRMPNIQAYVFLVFTSETKLNRGISLKSGNLHRQHRFPTPSPNLQEGEEEERIIPVLICQQDQRRSWQNQAEELPEDGTHCRVPEHQLQGWCSPHIT